MLGSARTWLRDMRRGELGLGIDPVKVTLCGGENGEQRADVVLHGADEGEVRVRMTQAGEGLEQVRDAFAQADLAGEEDFKGIRAEWFGGSELVETDAVGDNVELFRRDAHLEEGAAGDVGGDGDGVGEGVDGLFAAENVGGRREVWEAPAAIFFGDDFVLKALVG